VRSGAGTDNARVGSIPFGRRVEVIGQGRDADGNLWYRVEYQDIDGWVLGSLTTAQRPVADSNQPTAAPAQPTQSDSGGGGLPGGFSPDVVPTEPPAAPAGFACNCGKLCSQMASCDEAYFQLNTCGCGARDSDNDGVPCESICPGG